MFVRQGSGLSPVAGVSSQCSVCSLAPLSAVACLRQITHTQGADGCRPQHPQTHKARPGQLNVLDLYECVCVFMYKCEIMHKQHMSVLSSMFACTVFTSCVSECVCIYVCVTCYGVAKDISG